MDDFSHYSLGPSHCCDLLANMDLQRMSRDESLCDVRFVIGNDCVYAHRSVLAICSAFIQGMLSGAFIESQGEGGTNSKMMEVDLSRSTSTLEDLDVLLSAVYTGSLKLSSHNIVGVTELACFLLVERVREVCQSFLLETLTLQSCLRSLELAHRYDLSSLFTAARRLLRSRFHDHFIHQPDTLLTSASCLVHLTTIYHYVPLHDTVQFLVRWVDAYDQVGGAEEEERVRRLTTACYILTSVCCSKRGGGHSRHLSTVSPARLVGSADVLEELLSACRLSKRGDGESGQQEVFEGPSIAQRSDAPPLCGNPENVDWSAAKCSGTETPCRKDATVCSGRNNLRDADNGCGKIEGDGSSKAELPSCSVEDDDAKNCCSAKVIDISDKAMVSKVTDICEDANVDNSGSSDADKTAVSDRADVEQETATDVQSDSQSSNHIQSCPEMCEASNKRGSSSRDAQTDPCDHSESSCRDAQTDPCDHSESSCSCGLDKIHGTDRENVGDGSHIMHSPNDRRGSTCSDCSSQDQSSDDASDSEPDMTHHTGIINDDHARENDDCREEDTVTPNRKRPMGRAPHSRNCKHRRVRETGGDLDPDLTNVVVAFVPDQQAVKYFTATEHVWNRPRSCPLKFHVCVYHIGQRQWLLAGSAVFPEKFEERHSWRVACVNCKAYFISLVRQSIHVLDLRTMGWSWLDCQPLLHFFSTPCISRVRSLLPIAVGNHLYALASNRQPTVDGSNSFTTMQQYFVLQEDGRGWTRLDVVDHTHMATPLTVFSVSGRKVFVVKASIALNLEKSMLFLQDGHIFDCETGTVEMFRCTTYAASPVRILVREGQIHIVDGSSNHLQLLVDHQMWEHKGTINLSDIKLGRAASAESHLPCLTHSSTTMGSSVWEFSTFPMHRSALTELRLNHKGKIFTVRHTPPPFYYMTITSACQLSSEFVASLKPCVYLHAEAVN